MKSERFILEIDNDLDAIRSVLARGELKERVLVARQFLPHSFKPLG
jgi:hypothetical protein